MKTVLVKRSIENMHDKIITVKWKYPDYKPTKHGWYMTNCGNEKFENGKFDTDDGYGGKAEITYWYEEIELSKLLAEVMPTEEVERFIIRYSGYHPNVTFEQLGESQLKNAEEDKNMIDKFIEYLKSKLSN